MTDYSKGRWAETYPRWTSFLHPWWCLRLMFPGGSVQGGMRAILVVEISQTLWKLSSEQMPRRHMCQDMFLASCLCSGPCAVARLVQMVQAWGMMNEWCSGRQPWCTPKHQGSLKHDPAGSITSSPRKALLRGVDKGQLNPHWQVLGRWSWLSPSIPSAESGEMQGAQIIQRWEFFRKSRWMSKAR